MTFGELIEEVEENIRGVAGAERIQRQEIARKLNLAQREIGAQIGIPRMYVNIPADGSNQVGAFTLPGDYLPDQLKWIEVVEFADADFSGYEELKNYRIPVYTVSEANRLYPRWENDDNDNYDISPPFLIYDPAAREEGVQPVGFSSARYRALLVVNTPDMSAMTDEPFAVMDTSVSPAVREGGNFPGYHRMLAFYVTYEMMLKLGDERGQPHYQKFTMMRDELFAQFEQPNQHYPRWRRGRRAYS